MMEIFRNDSSFPPLLRLLLLSDGTVTSFLEALLGEALFELLGQEETVATEEEAKRLSIPKGDRVLKRRGWLTGPPHGVENRQKLLYVTSLFPIAPLTPTVYRQMQFGKKSLGQIIAEQELLFRRDEIEVGRFAFPEIAPALGIRSHEPLWARRSRFILSGGVVGRLLEVVSPTLASSSDTFHIPKTDVVPGKMA